MRKKYGFFCILEKYGFSSNISQNDIFLSKWANDFHLKKTPEKTPIVTCLASHLY